LATCAHCWLLFSWVLANTPVSNHFFHTVFQPQACRLAVAKVQDLALVLAELHPIGLSPVISPSRSLCRAFLLSGKSSQVGVICKLTEGALNPLVQIILNRASPSTDPWGISLMTGRQLDVIPFTTTLWAWLSSRSVPRKERICSRHGLPTSPGEMQHSSFHRIIE